MTIKRNRLDTIDFSDVSDGTRLATVHPGEVLLHDFMEPLQITQYRLAITISVPPRRINEIVHGKRAITADTALRLGRFFGTTADFWMALQSAYDTETAKQKITAVLAAIPTFSSINTLPVQRLAA